MSTKNKPGLIDVTGWLRLCYEDAGIAFPEGEKLILPAKVWRRWKKNLHLIEPADADIEPKPAERTGSEE